MNVIGFDFGTTNSTISFYNTETKTLDCFQTSASSTDYIPTVVAYKGNEVCIGDIAKKNLTKKLQLFECIISIVHATLSLPLAQSLCKRKILIICLDFLITL